MLKTTCGWGEAFDARMCERAAEVTGLVALGADRNSRSASSARSSARPWPEPAARGAASTARGRARARAGRVVRSSPMTPPFVPRRASCSLPPKPSLAVLRSSGRRTPDRCRRPRGRRGVALGRRRPPGCGKAGHRGAGRAVRAARPRSPWRSPYLRASARAGERGASAVGGLHRRRGHRCRRSSVAARGSPEGAAPADQEQREHHRQRAAPRRGGGSKSTVLCG